MKSESNHIKKFIIIGIAFVAIFFISFRVGYYPLSVKQVVLAFLYKFNPNIVVEPQAVTIFWSIRLPRILSALLIGSALSVAGSVYQGIFQNPLVSPDILGVSSGAGLGAALAISFGLAQWKIQTVAFFSGILVVALCYVISKRAVHSQTLSLVLTGTMMSSLCNAAITAIKYFSDPNDVLQQITFWLMGSLTKVNMNGIKFSIIPMMIGFVIIFSLRWRINLLVLSDEESKSMGGNPQTYRLVFIVAATLLSASAVCLGGLIGWVGLMIPHIARGLFGANYKQLVPACALIGGGFLMVMDDIARSVMTLELPIGVITAFLGAPFFVFLILRKRSQ